MSSVTSLNEQDSPGFLSTPVGLAAPAEHLRDLTPEQWKSGLAAWLGWLFDGLDIHLYTLVALPFVASLLHTTMNDPAVRSRSSWIQAAFLVGWAVGGTVFGWIGDRLGRSRTLGLTILTYAAFTGLSYFAQTWWQLMIFRFLAALGIGGEWAVGSALLAETWPARLRPWAAACLQTAVNLGVLIACGVTYLLAEHQRAVFLVGIAPAILVFWIRRSVPEPPEWLAARQTTKASTPSEPLLKTEVSWTDLFRAQVLSITIKTALVCAFSLTAWWGFMFWISQHVMRLGDVLTWSETDRTRLASINFFIVIGVSIAGNFFAALLAKRFGYRRAITLLFLGFFLSMVGTFWIPRGHASLLWWTPWVGSFSGVFGLFTMYLPPLFPTLLRTTGAGFSFNIGRLAAAFGTVFFGLFASVENYRRALLFNSLLLIPAMLIAMTLPDLEDTAPASAK